MGIRVGFAKAVVNFGSMVRGLDQYSTESVKQEFSLAIDFGRGFFGVSAQRQVEGRVPNGGAYWALYRKLQATNFTFEFFRDPIESVRTGNKLGYRRSIRSGV